MEIILIYAAVFVAGLILFDRLLRTLFRTTSRSKALNRRLKLLDTEEDHLAVYQSMVKERALDYNRHSTRLVLWLRRLFAQSGLRVNLLRIALYGIGGAAVLWLGLGLLTSSTMIKLVLIAATLAGLPIFIMYRARSKRIGKFTVQLPGALDVVNRSLASGHPLPSAIALVSRELPDPVGTEFGMLSDELTYGTDLDDAMLNMIERVGAEDLKLLAISMSVQRGTGGNFVEILENLANVIRDRAMLRAKVRALSAEGRITAIVMSAFPLLLYFMINALSPTYFNPVWESGYAHVVLSVGVVVMLIGNFILYKLVHFDF
ncbi:type II secretion system F family protein [Chelativorans salis]|uniref:Type II secretion system F family protein n=1 Tax=Chelativorans salis TaxID=2978478 RepID=A0ABT2LJQ7_9HYPH|nr:type II secretion system F family protein [Chelativorans sp. EGI FJ00035]MCT7374657.1 type II secretion system F family protein [Chelativorans sp. EGI FJ00035]